MFLRNILVAFLIGVVAGPVAAQCTGPSLLDRLTPDERDGLHAATADMPFSEGLLWSAQRDGKTLTIAGTIHIHDPGLDAIAARLDDAIAQADLVLLEITPDEEQAMQDALLTSPDRLFITDGPTLPEQLDEETWAMVVEALRARDIPPFLAAKFQPWYLMIALSLPPCAVPEMTSGSLGLDHMVMARASAAGVPMQPLESWDMMLDMLQASESDDQLALLRMSLLGPDLQEEMFVALRDTYLQERIGQVWELSRLSLRFMPEIDVDEAERILELTRETLLIARNRAWIPVIEAAADRHDRIIVAAGAGHLPGEDGILALLEENGWTISPLEQGGVPASAEN